jgi:xanthine dehydrogenase accessory factor
MFDILESVDQWLAMDKGVALATVVSTWGSAPRHTGAKMAVTANLEMTGSVSGGCVEAAVVEAAQATLRSGKPRRLDFGVSDDQAWEVGLACGGKIQVWVEPLEAAWWSVMREALSQERPFTAITLLEGEEAGLKLVLDQDNLPLYASAECSMERSKALSEAPRRATTGLDTLLGTAALVEVFQRRPHLIIVGGVHGAQPDGGDAGNAGDLD